MTHPTSTVLAEAFSNGTSRAGRPVPEGVLPLAVRNLNKRYTKGPWANKDINLEIGPGEVLGILGPNGAGKTTLVRQITTELLPTSGEIEVLGHDVIKEAMTVKANMGVMPQEVALFDYLTVHQHLTIFGKLRGLSPPNARLRADELMAELGLVPQRNVITRKISGGMRRRLLVGIAALAKPALMVLDEPTAGLDPEARRTLWSLIREYRGQGSSVLLTTHYMEEAETLCDRVGIILDGELLALDTVTNLRSKYGYQFKVTYSVGDTGWETATLYGSNDVDLVDRVRSMGYRDFAVSQTTLEDIYFALTSGREESSDGLA